MKIIHCADLHLDSGLLTNLSEEMAIGRRNELLDTFLRIVRYAKENQVRIILIAGDLFDAQKASSYTIGQVLKTITSHPKIIFFYVTGNHEKMGFVQSLSQIPTNLKLFHDYFTSYTLSGGGLTISGMNPGNEDFYDQVVLPKEALNLVLLHGDITQRTGQESIRLEKLANRHIDYLALGHLHSYQTGALDARGTYTYAGCTEGRGYDESGDKGFVLLDVDVQGHTITQEFIPFATRRVHVVNVDVTSAEHAADVIAGIKQELSRNKVQTKDYAKVVLCGETLSNIVPDEGVLMAQFADFFYDFRVENHTTCRVDYGDYRKENTLRGEYIRLVEADETLTDTNKAQMIRYGLAALSGEEVRP